jgi:uncharacterized OB-fold protein
MNRYKVIRCKNCGRVSVSSATKVFKCTYCGKSEKIFKEKVFGVSVNLLKSFDAPKEATLFCQKYKQLEVEKNESNMPTLR